jgi:hypothetical protein
MRIGSFENLYINDAFSKIRTADNVQQNALYQIERSVKNKASCINAKGTLVT